MVLKRLDPPFISSQTLHHQRGYFCFSRFYNSTRLPKHIPKIKLFMAPDTLCGISCFYVMNKYSVIIQYISYLIPEPERKNSMSPSLLPVRSTANNQTGSYLLEYMQNIPSFQFGMIMYVNYLFLVQFSGKYLDNYTNISEKWIHLRLKPRFGHFATNSFN